MIKRKFNKKHKGQGVIEYAGALVIAAALVAAVLTVGPTAITDLFTNIMTTVSGYLEGELSKNTGG
jgi:Flp pilus assembly pilin Flp